jgi:hypothetical protein
MNRHRRYLRADAALFALVALLVIVLGLASSKGGGSGGHRWAATVLAPSGGGRTIPSGFLGLSIEYPALASYGGTTPADIDPVFEQLIRNLAPGQAPVLRIGGDSTDSTWWPLKGVARPPGVSFSLTQRWIQVTRKIAAAVRARLILGVNLEADSSQIAAAEAEALIAGIGRGAIRALELGNEPELYSTFAWYRKAGGKGVPGRSRGYDFAAFLRDFAAIATSLPRYPLAGPALSGSSWTRGLGQFLASQPHVELATLHRYPLQLCFTPRSSLRHPSIRHLLAAHASRGLAESLAGYVRLAHAHGLPFRLDELNTVACGAERAVSETFASALWALDALFELARVGIDGVNMHTFPGAGYELFRISRSAAGWRASIGPEYYGLLMFAQAAPAGARLLPVATTAGAPVRVWATETRDGRVRVTLINKSLEARGTVAVQVRGDHRPGTLERLEGPDAAASTGIELGGRSFDPRTATGVLRGTPRTTSVSPVGGRYLVEMPPTSAALLTLGQRGR